MTGVSLILMTGSRFISLMNVERVKASGQKRELPLKGAHQTQNGSGNLGRLNEKTTFFDLLLGAGCHGDGDGRINKQLIVDNSSSAAVYVT